MKRVKIIVVITLFTQLLLAQTLTQGKITFKIENQISDNFKSEAITFIDSVMEKGFRMMLENEELKDAVVEGRKEYQNNRSEIIKEMTQGLLKEKGLTWKEVISFKPDEVIREKFDDKNSKLQHFKIFEDGRVVKYDFWTKKGEYIYLNEDNIHVLPKEIVIEIDKNDHKKILNYDCYKVKVIEQNSPDENAENGEEIDNVVNSLMSQSYSIYEMYVTEDIKLFSHAILEMSNPLKGYFPLEIVV
jgi:hypothetical protein